SRRELATRAGSGGVWGPGRGDPRRPGRKPRTRREPGRRWGRSRFAVASRARVSRGPGLELRAVANDVIDQAVVLGLGRAQPEVAIAVLVDLLNGAAGGLGDDLVVAAAELDDLLGRDVDLDRAAADDRGWLV